MVSDIKNGLVSHVVVYKLDRLSRSQKDTLYLIEDVLIPNGVSFVSLNENMDTSTPIGRAMLGIMSAFAQLERETIRERTRMGMKERIKSGLVARRREDPVRLRLRPGEGDTCPQFRRADGQTHV